MNATPAANKAVWTKTGKAGLCLNCSNLDSLPGAEAEGAAPGAANILYGYLILFD